MRFSWKVIWQYVIESIKFILMLISLGVMFLLAAVLTLPVS